MAATGAGVGVAGGAAADGVCGGASDDDDSAAAGAFPLAESEPVEPVRKGGAGVIAGDGGRAAGVGGCTGRVAVA